jgi:hypothetical protein
MMDVLAIAAEWITMLVCAVLLVAYLYWNVRTDRLDVDE